MKKKLLPILTIGLLTAASAQAPSWYMKDVDVKVKPNTLVWVGENGYENATAADLTPSATVKGVFSNEGNVYVDDNFKNLADPEFFVLENDGANDVYGQLIIDDGATAEGKVVLERLLRSDQDWMQMAFPFTSYTGEDAVADLNEGLANPVMGRFPTCTSGICGARYQASFMYWDNDNILYEHVKDGAADLDPTMYYIANANRHGDWKGKFVSLKGVPNNVQANYTAMQTLSSIDAASTNKFNEVYSSYVEDILVTDNSDAQWGVNQYQFPNPYTSNVDVSFLGVDESADYEVDGADDLNNFGDDIEALSYADEVTWTAGNNGTATSSVIVNNTLTFSPLGAIVAGDVDKAVVEPTVPMVVKMADNTSLDLNLSDANKVFHDESFASTSADGTTGTRTNVVSRSSFSEGNALDVVSQIGVVVLENGNKTANKFYVALSNLFDDANFSRMEAATRKNGNTIYTIQESIEGGLVQGQATEAMYINGVTHDFIGKAIPVGVKLDNSNPKTEYTIATHLRSDNGKILAADERFESNEDFYFHDKELNNIILMDNDFEYTFTVTESTEERFEIFVGDPISLNVNDVTDLKGLTKVYKNAGNDTQSVRFSQDQLGSSASVTVFNAVGQVIVLEKNVSTDTDYVLPIKSQNSSNFYLVRIKGENGTIVTEKILY